MFLECFSWDIKQWKDKKGQTAIKLAARGGAKDAWEKRQETSLSRGGPRSVEALSRTNRSREGQDVITVYMEQ